MTHPNPTPLVEAAERAGTGCTKWDGIEKRFGNAYLLPLWIADMDFKAPPCVREALAAVVEHGVFGYQNVPDGYYTAFMDWERRRHGYTVEREWLRYSAGVVAAIYWILQFTTEPGDACIILSPNYYPFMHAVQDTGRTLVCSPLVEAAGRYTVDLAAFEADIVRHDARVFILCSPHNPVGRVWTREELAGMMAVCKKHNLFVISDEIHGDLELFGHKHIPTATLADYDSRLITLAAGSKTFNLAGCQNSYVIIPDEHLRKKFDTYVNTIRMEHGSMFGYTAMEAAFRGGEAWLDEVLAIVEGNFTYLRDTLLAALPDLVVTPLEGTYLMWVDLGAYASPADMKALVQDKCRLAVDYGDWFYDNRPDTHIRINLATPRHNIEEAARRMVEHIPAWRKGS